MRKIFRLFIFAFLVIGFNFQFGNDAVAQKSLLSSPGLNSQEEFLEPNQAFKLDASIVDGKELRLFFEIAQNYYMYREQFEFSVIKNGKYVEKLTPSKIPEGVIKFDPTFNKDLEVYHDNVEIRFALPPQGGAFTLEARSQGCAEAGLCYPPAYFHIPIVPMKDGYEITLPNRIEIKGQVESPEALYESRAGKTWYEVPMSEESWEDSNGATGASSDSGGASGGSGGASGGSDNASSSGSSGGFSFGALFENNDIAIADFLQNSNIAIMVLGAFFLGVLLSFTPCVLPMLPILLSVLVGHQGGRSMAMAGAGAGAGTGAGGVSASRVADSTHEKKRSSGSLRLTLFYVLGTSIVYTILGVLAASIGASLSNWIQNPWVVAVFALFLVAFALSMFGVFTFQMPSSIQTKLTVLQNKLPAGSGIGAMIMGMISALIAGPCVAAPLAGVLLFISQTGNVALGALILFVLAWGQGTSLILVGSSSHALLPKAGRWMEKVKTVCGILLLAAAVWMIWPVVGNLFGDSREGGAGSALNFVKVERIEEFESQLKGAVADGKPTMLYISAEWCISCRELKHFTFSDSKVQEELSKFKVVEADVTTNKAYHRDLLKKFKLFGPPGLIFFDKEGNQSKLRIVGFEGPEEFVKDIKSTNLY